MSSREPTSAEPIGAPSPFEKQTETVSNGAAIARAVVRGSPPSATAALKRRAPSRWVERPRLLRDRARRLEVRDRQRLAADRVLEAEQPAPRVVRVVGLDRRLDRRRRQRAVGLVLERLRLDAAERRRAAAFPAVGVRHLADDVLVAAAAVAHDRDQVALRAAGHEERRFLAEQRGDPLLQRVDGRIVAEDVVADLGRGHRRAHRRRRPRHGVAAQVDHARMDRHRAASRKFFSIACPCSVRIDSGWNWTPSSGVFVAASSRWRTPMISPSLAVDVTSSSRGSDSRSSASEW